MFVCVVISHAGHRHVVFCFSQLYHGLAWFGNAIACNLEEAVSARERIAAPLTGA